MAKAAKKGPVKKAESKKKADTKPVVKKKSESKKVVKKEVVDPEGAEEIQTQTEEIPQEILNSEPAVEKDCPEVEPELGATEFDEFTIKEIMVQKSVSRLEAINILRNPST